MSIMLINSSLFASDYKPVLIKVNGELRDIHTNLPLQKIPVYAATGYMSDLEKPRSEFSQNCITNKKGEFNFELYLDENKPEFFIKIGGAAQIHFKHVPTDTSALDLGKIYTVFYDNELKENRINIPSSSLKKMARYVRKEERAQNKSKLKVHSVAEIIHIFNSENLAYNMTLNQVDTAGPYITRLNFGAEKPRGTIIQNYIKISFTRDFSKVKNEGTTELIRYNQRELYVKHQIDSLQIKKYELHNQDTILLRSTKKYINQSGYIIKDVEICENGTISFQQNNDSIGRQLWISVMRFECDGRSNGHIETFYGKDGPIKKESYFYDSLLGTTWLWNYDSLGREVEYQCNVFFSPSWSEYTKYFNQGDSTITLKIKENGDTLLRTIVNYNNGRKHLEREFIGDTLIYITNTSYNKYGQIYNVQVYDSRNEIQLRDDYFYYKTPFKLVSQKQLLTPGDKTYLFTRYKYNERGFLIQETYENSEDKPSYFFQYEYFSKID